MTSLDIFVMFLAYNFQLMRAEEETSALSTLLLSIACLDLEASHAHAGDYFSSIITLLTN